MLEVDSVDTFYDEVQVLKKVSIKVIDGELLVLLGPNGHGKSTLLKTICGLHRLASGSIRFIGKEISRLPTEKIVEMGITYIAEERELFNEMNVIENLTLGAYNRNARQNEAKNLEHAFQLFPRLRQMKKRLAGTLSGGEAKMLAIARGLMSDAKLLAIDEPSLGLAPIIRHDVFDSINEINERGTGILLVEQNIPQVSEIADRIYLMEGGEIIFEGDKQRALSDQKMMEAFLGM